MYCSRPWPFNLKTCVQKPAELIVQELCEIRGGRPGLSVLTSLMVALRPRKRDGLLLGRELSGKGMTKWRLDCGNRPKKTGENNGGVKAVSPLHCPATCALRNCCFNCCAWTESQRQCPLHCCWRTTRSKRGPTCSALLHLPTHDLFWANLRVQLHLPPLRSLDLLISPGTLTRWPSWAPVPNKPTVSVDVKQHSTNQAGSVPFPQVSLQRQVVCLLLRPVFMCSSQGRACK